MLELINALLPLITKDGPEFRKEHLEIRNAMRVVEVCFEEVIERPIVRGKYSQKVDAYKSADAVVRALLHDSVDLPYAYRALALRGLSSMWFTVFDIRSSWDSSLHHELSDRLQTLYGSKAARLYTIIAILTHWLRHAVRGVRYPLYLPPL